MTTLCDRIKSLAPLSRPIKIKTKTNSDLLARFFPRYMYFLRILIGPSVACVCCDWPEYLLLFWLYDTQLKTALLTEQKLNQSVSRVRDLLSRFFRRLATVKCFLLLIFDWFIGLSAYVRLAKSDCLGFTSC